MIGRIFKLTHESDSTSVTEFSKCAQPETTHCEGVHDGASFRKVENSKLFNLSFNIVFSGQKLTTKNKLRDKKKPKSLPLLLQGSKV